MGTKTEAAVSFHSTDRELEKGFERVKHQALHWVFEGHPVGDYYEASLPNRDAFCMRDTSHQATGAEVLGLSRHNKNMFLKFARSIAPERDYCAFWEIDRWDRPCQVDYTDDTDFWYNLPANFDVLDACWRMYLWTGDRDYLCHPDFDRFFALTMEEYIKKWDHDNDGIPDASHLDLTPSGENISLQKDWRVNRRGVAGYEEGHFARSEIAAASDTCAALGRAYLSYANICKELDRKEQEYIYRKRGQAILDRLDTEFYTDEFSYAVGLGKDRQRLYYRDDKQKIYIGPAVSLVYWDAIRDIKRLPRLLDVYKEQMPFAQIEYLSHYPEIQWRYGRNNDALLSLRRLMDPALPRKEYPEASFCTIGAVATGLMGLFPNSAQGIISTLPGLAGIEWAEMNHIPVMRRNISIYHEGDNKSAFNLEEGEPAIWRCRFWGLGTINVPNRNVETKQGICAFTGKSFSYADIEVNQGETIISSLEC